MLANTNRPITVGSHAQGGKFVAQMVIGNREVVWVNYKSQADALPSIIDGSLDLYAGGAWGTTYVKSGHLKSFGYINGPTSIPGPNLAHQYKHAAELKIILSINTTNKNAPEDVEEMNKRIKIIMGSADVLAVLEGIGNVPIWTSVNESADLIKRMNVNYSTLIETLREQK